MLKIIVIHGSPHKGQTYNATAEFISKLRDRIEIEVKDVVLFQERLELCRGCGNCITHGEEKCSAKDRLPGIHALIKESDAVIVTTPIYALQVTTLVKNFIERSSYVMHRPCYFGKWFMSLSTQFIGGDKDAAKYLASVMRFWGFNIIPGLRITMAQDKPAISKKIDDAVNRFAAIDRQNRFPIPTWKDLVMFRFRRSAVTAKSYSDIFPRDTEYFREKGWLESAYYYDVPLNPLMNVAGKFFDAVGRKMSKNNGNESK